MSEIRLTIDNKEVSVEPGATVLDAARQAGASVPTLCHHRELEPFGGCRLCMVEWETPAGARLIASCIYPAEEGMRITTRSAQIDKLRKTLLELYLAHAPFAPALLELAEQVGAKPGRFTGGSSFCVHCGLCVRYCAEAVGQYAVGFVDRGIRKEIAFVPEIAAEQCDACQACFPLCPTSYLQAAYVLTRSLSR